MKPHFFLLRGLARESGHWGEFLPKLANSQVSSRITTMDLPGTGENLDQSPTWSLDKTLDFLQRRYAHELQTSQPKCLLGVSLGGMLAWHWLARDPGRFDYVILVNSSLGGITRFYQRLSPFAWRQLVKIAMNQKNPNAREKLIMQMVSSSPLDPKALALWEELYKTRPIKPTTVLKQIWMGSRSGFVEVPNPPRGLILSSANDRMVNPIASHRLAKASNFTHIIHQQAGHDLPLDDPDWIIDTMFRWFRSYGDMQHQPARVG